MHFVAIQQGINSLVVVVWAGIALALKADIWMVVAALIAGQAVETCLGWQFIRTNFSPGFPAGWDGRLLSAIIVSSFPIGITAMLQALNIRIEVLVLGRYVTDQVLGQFQAVAWFPVGIFLLTSLLMTVLFPKLSRLMRKDSVYSRAYLTGLLKNGLQAATLGSIVLWFCAPSLVVWVFGERLSPAAPTLRLLAPMLPLVFLNTVLFYVFIAAHRRGVYMGTLGLGVVLGLGLSFILTAYYGVVGCVLAGVLREFTMCCFYLYFLIQGNHARAAGWGVLKVHLLATVLVALAALVTTSPGDAGQWSAAWIVLLLVGTLVTLGFPRRTEWQLLTDDSL
jgi:O-antigen/teichoic acid export membrane protein